MDKPIAKFTKKQLDTMLYAEPTKIKVEGINLTFEGIIPQDPEVDAVQGPGGHAAARRRFVERAMTFEACPSAAAPA